MTRSALPASPPDSCLRNAEDRAFWQALVGLAAMGNVSQAALAAFVGVSQGYVSKILTGKQTPKLERRRRFAAFFNLDYEAMVAFGREQAEAEDDRSRAAEKGRCQVREPLYSGGATEPTALHAMLRGLQAHQRDYTEVPLREATGSMGGGSTETGDRTLSYLSFRTDWIRSKGNPENMTVIRAFGESMEPTIADGSVVLIDEGRRQFVKNKIYYLRYNGQMYIKRLVDRGGQLAIVADNDPNSYLIADADDFEIIGRCIWAARELD